MIFSLRRLLPVFFVPLLLLDSCENCELEREMRIQIDLQNTAVFVDRSFDEWAPYSNALVLEKVQRALESWLSDPGQMIVVDTLPDYILRINRIDGLTVTDQQQLQDPCQEDRNLLGDILIGYDYTTFTLESANLTIAANLMNAQTGTGRLMTFTGKSGQSTYQPPSMDTVNCNAYQVQGEPDPENAIRLAGQSAQGQVKCQLFEWTKD